MDTLTEKTLIPEKRLGKAPRKIDPRNLQFAKYIKAVILPKATNFWKKRSPFPLRSFGNNEYGDCTRASQALLSMRMERLETKRTPQITDQEVIRVYLEMTQKLYGGGDTGAYELDALNEWRNPETTFKDTKGRPLTIDAFTQVNHNNIDEIKTALFLSKSHGIKMCFNLPLAWSRTWNWDIPEGQELTRDYEPGSWGGHSMVARDYDSEGVFVPHSWGVPDGKVSWKGILAYCDEVYVVIDSVNAWKKKVGDLLDIDALVEDVNNTSSTPIVK